MSKKRLTPEQQERHRKFINIVEAVTKKVVESLTDDDDDDWGDEDWTEDDDEDIDPIEEYEAGYPNADDYNPDDMTSLDLIDYCKNFGDFFYIYPNEWFGTRLSVANSSEIQNEIIEDLEGCSHIEPTHEVDWVVTNKRSLFDFNTYITVFKVYPPGLRRDVLYIVYEQDR